MTSLYEQTVPVLIQSLRNLSVLLARGAEHCAANNIDPETLLNAKLTKDMYILKYSAQFCCSACKWMAVRVGEHEEVVFPDTEKTFDDLQTRIAATIKYLEAIDPKGFEGKEKATVVMDMKYGDFRMSGQTYCLQYTFANFCFHMTTVYWILKDAGVPVGPFDYIGPVFTKVG